MKILTFTIAGNEYAIDINHIKEVLRDKKTQPIPHTADWFEGIINYNDKIVPVINLNKVFYSENRSSNTHSSRRIIIVNTDEQMIGLVIDLSKSVTSVKDNEIESLEKVPDHPKYLTGAIRTNDSFTLIIDPEQLITKSIRLELENVESIHN